MHFNYCPRDLLKGHTTTRSFQSLVAVPIAPFKLQPAFSMLQCKLFIPTPPRRPILIQVLQVPFRHQHWMFFENKIKANLHKLQYIDYGVTGSNWVRHCEMRKNNCDRITVWSSCPTTNTKSNWAKRLLWQDNCHRWLKLYILHVLRPLCMIFTVYCQVYASVPRSATWYPEIYHLL